MKHNICDSITIIVPIQEVTITHPERFTPNAKLILNGQVKGDFCRCYQNPTKKEFAQGVYKPCLTLSSAPRLGGMSVALKIQLSLPKLLFGNNIREVSDSDLMAIVEKLQESLKNMGVEVRVSTLLESSVVSIHYGKNIIMPKGIATATVLQEIEKSQVSYRFDSNSSSYKNEGSALRFNTNQSEISIYDKKREYVAGLKSDKRSVEKYIVYQNISQEVLKDMEILRLEVRLNSSSKIRAMLKKIGYEDTPKTLKGLFNGEIAQKINMSYWQDIITARTVLRLGQEDDNNIFKRFLQTAKPLKALQLFAVFKLLQTSSAREVKWLLGKENPTIAGLFKAIKQTKPSSGWMDNIFEHVSKTILANEAINFNDFME